MAIRKIPADTKHFHFHNENPNNSRAADCVFRAIATATGKTWEEVFKGLCEVALEKKLAPNEDACYEEYLKRLGWVKQKQPRHSDNTKFTGVEFAEAHHETAICKIGCHHISCCKEGKFWDTWDCTDRTIGNYWRKKD